MLLALIGFMPTEGGGAIGSLDTPPSERRRLARCSLEWVCPVCGIPNKDILPLQQENKERQEKTMAEVADIVDAMVFKVGSPLPRVSRVYSSKRDLNRVDP